MAEDFLNICAKHIGAGITLTEESSDEAHELLPFAIGNTSFIEISSECYYVDKTLLIRDLIDDHNMVTLFTRPRRFGKTLTINTIKTFFEKTDEDTARYFTNKKIWQCGDKYRVLQGKYPVIMLTFKDVKYNSWEESMEAIRLVVKDEFKRHPELAGIRRIYNTEVLSWIRTQQTGNIISEIEKAVFLCDGKRLKDALRKYMITSISFFDGAAEGFYHGTYFSN